jgi:hypothetical protein
MPGNTISVCSVKVWGNTVRLINSNRNDIKACFLSKSLFNKVRFRIFAAKSIIKFQIAKILLINVIKVGADRKD